MGDTSLENVMAHEEQRISEAFAELEENDNTLGPIIFSEKGYVSEWHQGNATVGKLKAQWDELINGFKSLTPEASLVQHGQLLQNLEILLHSLEKPPELC